MNLAGRYRGGSKWLSEVRRQEERPLRQSNCRTLLSNICPFSTVARRALAHSLETQLLIQNQTPCSVSICSKQWHPLQAPRASSVGEKRWSQVVPREQSTLSTAWKPSTREVQTWLNMSTDSTREAHKQRRYTIGPMTSSAIQSTTRHTGQEDIQNHSREAIARLT